jgi:hypothetical protein
MPRKKIYANNAQKVRAYQSRKKDEVAVLLKLTQLQASSELSFSDAVDRLNMELTPDQKSALERVVSSWRFETEMKQVAG